MLGVRFSRLTLLGICFLFGSIILSTLIDGEVNRPSRVHGHMTDHMTYHMTRRMFYNIPLDDSIMTHP